MKFAVVELKCLWMQELEKSDLRSIQDLPNLSPCFVLNFRESVLSVSSQMYHIERQSCRIALMYRCIRLLLCHVVST